MSDGLYALTDADGNVIFGQWTDEESGETSDAECVCKDNGSVIFGEDITASPLYGTIAEDWPRNRECVLTYTGGAAGTISCPNGQTYEVVNPFDGSANYITPDVSELQ